MSKTDFAFNVLLSADTRAMLAQLSSTLNCSRGQVVRDSIRFRFAQTCNKTPTCSTGQPCLVPALHQQGQAPPVQLPPPDASYPVPPPT